MKFHPLADLFPMLEQPELDALAEDIKTNGQRDPIWTHEGKILDGRNRWLACKQAKAEPKVREYKGKDPLSFVVSMNLRRRHLSETQRAMVAARMATMNRGRPEKNGSIDPLSKSQPEAAGLLNVSTPSVKRARAVLESGSPDLIAACDSDRVAVSAAARIAQQPKERHPELLQRAIDQKRRQDDGEAPHVTYNTGENEWYTPAEYIEAARKAMGSIDLDPASNEKANEVVKAEKFYTREDDGLAKQWSGNVFLNPPYSSDLIGKFAAKVYSSADCYKQAVIVVNNGTDTEWFHKIISVASAVCFPRGRIKFWNPGKQKYAPLQGQAVIYIGDNIKSFVTAFHGFGFCCEVCKR